VQQARGLCLDKQGQQKKTDSDNDTHGNALPQGQIAGQWQFEAVGPFPWAGGYPRISLETMQIDNIIDHYA
jgi:hypothetical protein